MKLKMKQKKLKSWERIKWEDSIQKANKCKYDF